tara:strand:+ start:4783 stop:6033 length:1251 start_codon:yes stop_codon:yes gene_type:complete
MKKINISVIGLGYVGLPVAIELSKHFPVTGYDVSKKRIELLNKNNDYNDDIEFNKKNLNIIFTHDKELISKSTIYIITVPTPVNSLNKPDFSYLKKANETVGKNLKKGDIVVYESTVFPGYTNEIASKELEKFSKLKFNRDFYCGYSPERINPGDKKRTISKITKVVSGSNNYALNVISSIYKKAIKGGIFKAKSIRVAEASKVIENCQRDLNIAFINELSIIFGKMNISLNDVLDASWTKWNFLRFEPGLVGGHCIGVDPYYLTYKCNKIGYKPRLILAGRRINNSIPKKISEKIFKIKKNINKILIMGLTFKENCKDIRNSKVFDIIDILIKKNCNINIYDPHVLKSNVPKIYRRRLIKKIPRNKYDCIIIAVKHDDFKKIPLKTIKKYGVKNSLLLDLKNIYKNSKDRNLYKI